MSRHAEDSDRRRSGSLRHGRYPLRVGKDLSDQLQPLSLSPGEAGHSGDTAPGARQVRDEPCRLGALRVPSTSRRGELDAEAMSEIPRATDHDMRAGPASASGVIAAAGARGVIAGTAHPKAGGLHARPALPEDRRDGARTRAIPPEAPPRLHGGRRRTRPRSAHAGWISAPAKGLITAPGGVPSAGGRDESSR